MDTKPTTTPLVETSDSPQEQSQKSKKMPPTYKPLTKKFKTKAMEYISSCEKEAWNRRIFQNFEQQVIDHLDEPPPDEGGHIFMNTFVELVIMEVHLKNRMTTIPSWQALKFRYRVYEERRLSRYLWGKTTKYHAKVYREFINNEFYKRGITWSFYRPPFRQPKLRSKDGIPVTLPKCY